MKFIFNSFRISHAGVVVALLSIGVLVSCSASTSHNNPANRKSVPVFDGKVTLQNGEILEFVWVEEISLWVGKYEITLGQLTDFLRNAKKRPDHYAARYVEGSHDLNKFPAVRVSWDDANNACKTLNRKYGNELPVGTIFRLPTENEWEAIAKSGDERTYPWGDSWPPTPMSNGILPNIQGEEVLKIDGKVLPATRPLQGYQDGWPSMAPVDMTGANVWGIYGLSGNVSEWCEGWYDKDQKLRLLKGPSAFTSNSDGSKITNRSPVEGQSPARGWFIWGTIRNQGNLASGFRVVIGEPVGGN